MQTKEMIHDYQLAHWADIIRQRSESGLTVKAFCKSRGFNKSKSVYWQRGLRDKAYESLTKDPMRISDMAHQFTEATLAQHSTASANDASGEIRIEAFGIRITADSGYPPALIAALLREVMPLC
jgi:hypothetical protein